MKNPSLHHLQQDAELYDYLIRRVGKAQALFTGRQAPTAFDKAGTKVARHYQCAEQQTKYETIVKEKG